MGLLELPELDGDALLGQAGAAQARALGFELPLHGPPQLPFPVLKLSIGLFLQAGLVLAGLLQAPLDVLDLLLLLGQLALELLALGLHQHPFGGCESRRGAHDRLLLAAEHEHGRCDAADQDAGRDRVDQERQGPAPRLGGEAQGVGGHRDAIAGQDLVDL